MIPTIKASQRGFTLIELSVALAVIGVVVAGGLSMSTSMVDRNAYVQTGKQMDEVEKALAAFVAANGRLPCPATVNTATTAANFGEENRNAATGACNIAPVPGTGGRNVIVGGLPVRTLGLRNRYAADEYGHRYTYAVTAAMTNQTGYANTAGSVANNGAVIIQDSTNTPYVNDAAYAVVSHGDDGKGALRYETASANVACGATGMDAANCNGDATFREARFNRGSVAANFYDDTIRFSRKEMVNMAADVAGSSKQHLWVANGTNINNTNTGNVGVGTATPTDSKLRVVGATFGQPAIRATHTMNGSAIHGIGQGANPSFLAEFDDQNGAGYRANNNGWGGRLFEGIGDDNLNVGMFLDMSGEDTKGVSIAASGVNAIGLDVSATGNNGKGATLSYNNTSTAIEAIKGPDEFFRIGQGNNIIKNTIRTKADMTPIALSIDSAWKGIQIEIQNAQHSDPQGVIVQESSNNGIGGGSLFVGSSGSEYFTGVNLTMTGTSANGISSIVRGAGSTAITAMNEHGGARGCSIGTATNAIECNGPSVGVSDARLKKDVATLDKAQGLDAVRKLRPVTYGWNDGRSKETEIGFIAQEVQKLIPSIVSTLSEKAKDGSHYLGVQYDRLIAPLVLAVQQLAERLDGHDARIKALETENAALKARLDAIEKKLAK